MRILPKKNWHDHRKSLSREIERNCQIRVLAKAKAFPVIFRRGTILESLSRKIERNCQIWVLAKAKAFPVIFRLVDILEKFKAKAPP